MAASPIKPRDGSPEEQQRYLNDCNHFLKSPTRWGAAYGAKLPPAHQELYDKLNAAIGAAAHAELKVAAERFELEREAPLPQSKAKVVVPDEPPPPLEELLLPPRPPGSAPRPAPVSASDDAILSSSILPIS